MPSYVRSSPKRPEDVDSSSSSLAVGVFGGGRSSGISLNRGQNEPRSKRRKLLGTNSRFDRMIETMNMTNRFPAKPSRHSHSRTRSIGSSSTSQCDFPQTPAEAYDNQNGPLGKDFALIKMNSGHSSRSLVNMNDPLYNVSMTKPTSSHQDPWALPPWLSNTLTSLDSRHPLRLLLPKSPRPSLPPGLAEHSRNITAEDEPVFAFLPTDVSPDSVTCGLTAASGYVNMERNGSHSSNLSTTLEVLPFSTSGPGSHLPGLRPLVSPSVNISSHAQNATSAASSHDSVLDDDDPHSLDFVPFLTPGPGSLVSMEKSRSKSPQFLASAFAEDLTGRLVDSGTAGLLDSALFSTSGSTFLAPAFISDDTTSLRTSADPCLLSYVPSIFDAPHCYSSDDMPDYNVYYDDSLADDSASDPPFDQSAFIKPLPNLFATPGPGYQPPQQIYFDSPTEDFFDSDSLQPGHRIDYETLDFHWKPFNRKDTNILEPEKILPSMSQPTSYRAHLDIEQEIVQAATDLQDQSHTSPLYGHVSSPSPFAFFAGSQNEADTNNFSQELPVQAREVTPESPGSQRQMPPPFAPAPGIFLSPLSEAVVLKSLDETPCEPAIPCQKTNLLGALDKLYESPKSFRTGGRPDTPLSPNDSIESWKDVDFEL